MMVKWWPSWIGCPHGQSLESALPIYSYMVEPAALWAPVCAHPCAGGEGLTGPPRVAPLAIARGAAVLFLRALEVALRTSW